MPNPPGMTEGEGDAWVKVLAAATAVLDLPEQHPMEREEACHAFHQLQWWLLARPAYRSILDEPGKSEF